MPGGLWRQLAATDSGELTASSAASPNAASWAGSWKTAAARWFVYGHSVDYGMRSRTSSFGIVGSPRLPPTATSRRAASSGSDPATTSRRAPPDTRVPIALRDSFVDVDGTGSLVYFHGGLIGLNDSGGAGPWNFQAHQRAPQNSGVRFELPPQSLQNTNNLLATGAGYVKHEGGQLMFPSSLTVPARLVTTRSATGSLTPPSQRPISATCGRSAATAKSPTAGLAPTARWPRDNSITRAITINYALTMGGTGAGTQTVTADGNLPAFSPMMAAATSLSARALHPSPAWTAKPDHGERLRGVRLHRDCVGRRRGAARQPSRSRRWVPAAPTSETACLIPCRPGRRFTVHGYYWIKAAGGLSGTPAVNIRWAKRGMDKVSALAAPQR